MTDTRQNGVSVTFLHGSLPHMLTLFKSAVDAGEPSCADLSNYYRTMIAGYAIMPALLWPSLSGPRPHRFPGQVAPPRSLRTWQPAPGTIRSPQWLPDLLGFPSW